MMSKTDKPKPQKPGLLVTISLTNKQDFENYILAATIEFQGIHLENRIISKTLKEMTMLFEKLADGEAFFKIFENTKLKVEKAEC